jgi:hypothetical protein
VWYYYLAASAQLETIKVSEKDLSARHGRRCTIEAGIECSMLEPVLRNGERVACDLSALVPGNYFARSSTGMQWRIVVQDGR